MEQKYSDEDFDLDIDWQKMTIKKTNRGQRLKRRKYKVKRNLKRNVKKPIKEELPDKQAPDKSRKNNGSKFQEAVRECVTPEEKANKIESFLATMDAEKICGGVDDLNEEPSVSGNGLPEVKEETIVCDNYNFYEKMKDMEPLLFGKLDPTIPDFLLDKDIVLPEIPQSLKDEYTIVKDELVRLLATSSICFQLSENLSKTAGSNKNDINTDAFKGMFKSLIVAKAEEFASSIFDIRRFLLSKLTCRDPKVIPMMIRGSIQPNLSFFGNFAMLVRAVERNPKNILRLKSGKPAFYLYPKKKLAHHPDK